jgi:hypothetical protein
MGWEWFGNLGRRQRFDPVRVIDKAQVFETDGSGDPGLVVLDEHWEWRRSRLVRDLRVRWLGGRLQGWTLDRARSGFTFEPRDLWVGVFWDFPNAVRFNVYVTVIPCLPYLLSWRWEPK